VLQAVLEEIIPTVVLEVDANAILDSETMTDSSETLVDSDLLISTLVTPRTLIVTPGNGSGTGTVTITGFDDNGDSCSEAFVFDSDTVVVGTQIFASIDSVVLPAYTTDSDEAISIGWDLPQVDSYPCVIPNGQANLQFYLKSSQVSAAGVLGIEWYVSWDNTEWFELTESPFDVTTIAEAAQPEQISWGPGEVTAPYIKMRVIANDDIDETDKFTVQGWISQIPASAQ
jgi:hypothetical protein